MCILLLIINNFNVEKISDLLRFVKQTHHIKASIGGFYQFFNSLFFSTQRTNKNCRGSDRSLMQYALRRITRSAAQPSSRSSMFVKSRNLRIAINLETSHLLVGFVEEIVAYSGRRVYLPFIGKIGSSALLVLSRTVT